MLPLLFSTATLLVTADKALNSDLKTYCATSLESIQLCLGFFLLWKGDGDFGHP